LFAFEIVNSTPLPAQEAERLQALRRYNILDTPPEPAFDDLTRLAANLCGTAIAVISLVDQNRPWFKSRVGWEPTETPREGSFCAYAILGQDVFEVNDATQDERFAGSPLVTGPEHLRFYAGVPLCSPDGFNVGTLCVMDRQPHRLTSEQKEALRILAHQVMTHFELRRHLVELERSLGEERRAKEALRDSETFYEALVESLPQFIIRKDREGRFTFANAKFCAALGKPVAEILGRTDRDFYPAHLAEKYHRDDLRVMANRAPIDVVEANQSPEGGSIFVHVIKTPLLDAAGRVAGIQGIFWDVTERKKIEEQLAYERDLLRSLLENIPDRIYFKDVASRFIRCSRSMATRLGLSDPKDVVGKTDFDFHAPEVAQEYYQEEQRIVLTGQPLINKLQHTVDPDGRESWSAVTKVPVYNRHGTITGIVGLSRDISKLKEAEEALEQARDAALEHARVKSEFLANMSHEIRTPMNAIVGMADLLLGTPLAPEQRDYVETLRNGMETLLGLIHNILDFSKIEAGKLVLETIDFDLRQVIESTADMLAERIHRKGVELICWIDEDVPAGLRGDPGRLRQVLTNLLANAAKFTEAGQIVVRASKESESATHVSLRLTVADTGIGISAKALPSIFGVFTQADGSTTRKYGGTGLGLAISKQLVELMQGRIGVESAPDKGSTFWFVVPLEKQPVPAQSEGPAASLPTESARVLVVEDNATCREMLAHQLTLWKVRHETATHGIEALGTLRKAASAAQPYTLVLLDLQLPDMDGLALARAIRADPATAPTRLIGLTTMPCRLGAQDRDSAGLETCLLKPVKQARLFEVLAAALSARAPRQEPDGCVPSVAPSSAVPLTRPAHRPRILLAEDNLVNQRLALKQLEKMGYTPDAVFNGREALEAVQKTAYDIILIDCQMPEVDGYETTRRLRQFEAGLPPSARSVSYVVALTANALEGDRERGLAAGMNDYLTKPIRMEELRRALERASHHLQVPAPTEEDGVLDASVLASLKELREPGQPDPVIELIQLYLRDSKPKVDALECYAVGRRPTELKATAHSLKGSSNNLGARRLAGLLVDMEQAGKAADWPRAEQLLPLIKAEFQRVQERLLAETQAG
jgi:two-component system, sensor histidine kinase and response regulator